MQYYLVYRGIHPDDLRFYLPDSRNKFTCLNSKKLIPFSWVNDDYCDCADDGSDEPGTSACTLGIFYCKFQPM